MSRPHQKIKLCRDGISVSSDCLLTLKRRDCIQAMLILNKKERIPTRMVPLAAGEIAGINEKVWVNRMTGTIFYKDGSCRSSSTMRWKRAA